MIVKFRHKGLRDLFERNKAKGLNADWIDRIRRILSLLDAASEPAGMDIPGFFLHPLKGNLASFWSVRVSRNWRIIWRFDDMGNATEVDLIDYH